MCGRYRRQYDSLWRMGRLRSWCLLRDALDNDQLHGTRYRVDGQLSVLGPAVCRVMVVDVQQHVDIAAGGLEDDAAPVPVQANRLQVRVPSAVDVLVVDARAGGVRLELDGPLHHLRLHVDRQLGQLQQEVLRQCHLGFETHAITPRSSAALGPGGWL